MKKNEENKMRRTEEKLKCLDEQYNTLARRIIYERLSDFEYDQIIEALQDLEIRMIKLSMTLKNN